MRKIYLGLVLLLVVGITCYAQNVAINADGSTPDAKAILDIKSTTKGVLIPRMTTAERTAISPVPTGLLVYDNTTSSFWYYAGGAWQSLAAGWSITGNSGTDATTNFIGTTDYVPLVFRTNNELSGRIEPDATGNTFLGYLAAPGSAGIFNTAVGARALQGNSTGTGNTAIGSGALIDANGSFNTAIGTFSLNSTDMGSSNTAIGEYTLQSNITGSGNVAIGSYADMLSGGLVNAVAIGSSAIADANNKVRIGNTSITSIGGQVGWTTFSDGRYKQQVQEDVKGLDFIRRLRPVTYTVDIAAINSYYSSNNNKYKPGSTTSAPVIRQTGFIAQEVEQAAREAEFSFSGVDQPGNDKALYGLRYAEFTVPLVKAVQEQQQIIDEQNKKIADLQQQLEEIKQLLKRSK